MPLSPQEQDELLQLLSEKHGGSKEMPKLAEMPKEKSIGDFLSGFPAYVAGDLGEKAGALGAGVVGAARSVPFAEKAAAEASALINDSSYSQERDVQKAVLGGIEKKYPTATGVGQIGGMVANPISKLGLFPQAALYGASSTDVNPIESPSAAAGQIAANTATNMILPIALKATGALGRNLSDTKIGRPVTKMVENTAKKLGGYVSPEKLRVAEMLKKNISPSDLREAKNIANQAAKYGGVNLPAGITGGENLSGYAKLAAAQKTAAPEISQSIKDITNIIGRSTKNRGEVVKGSMGEQVSKMYDAAKNTPAAKPITLLKKPSSSQAELNAAADEYEKLKTLANTLRNSAKEKGDLAGKQSGFWRRKSVTAAAEEAKALSGVKQQLVNQESKIKSIESGLNPTLRTFSSDEEFQRLLAKNPTVAHYVQKTIDLGKRTGASINPNSLGTIKNARDLMKADNLPTDIYNQAKSQFEKVLGSSFKQADEGFKVLSDVRLKAGSIRNQASSTIQKSRGQNFTEAELSKSARGLLKTIGLAGRAAGAVIGISSQRLENLLASNPRAQKELVRLLLKVPAKDLAKELNVQPTVLNKLVDRLKTSGAIGLTEQMRNK